MSWLASPEKQRQRFARSRAGQIRDGMRNYIQTLAVIHTAWTERDWEALGYDSWQSYVDGEFGEERVQLPAEHRRKAVEELRLAGMSTRTLADTLGVDRNTVKRDLKQVGAVHPPDEVRGADGKTYRPARSPIAEAMEQAIADATDRAEDHRVPVPGEADAPASEPAAPAADGPEPDLPPSGSGSPNLPAVIGEESGSGVTSPTPDPDQEWATCEKCGSVLDDDAVDDGYLRCEECDPDWEHRAGANGNCVVCTCRTCGQPLPT